MLYLVTLFEFKFIMNLAVWEIDRKMNKPHSTLKYIIKKSKYTGILKNLPQRQKN